MASPAPAPTQEKEVFMDVATPQAGGGGRTRRRRGRRTQRQEGGATPDITPAVSVEKAGGAAPAPASAPAPAPVGKEVAPVVQQPQAGGASGPKVIIAPAKKKPAKVMLIPKSASQQRAAAIKKTFKAKRVHVTIDNTTKTIKRRRQVLGKVDAMTDEQVREAAVSARLSRRASVAKAPPVLLRQMLKDYQTMKGMLL